MRSVQNISTVVHFAAQHIDVAREDLQGAGVGLQRGECDPQYTIRVNLMDRLI